MLPIIIQVIVFLSRMFQCIKLKFENLIQWYYFFQKNVANIAKSAGSYYNVQAKFDTRERVQKLE